MSDEALVSVLRVWANNTSRFAAMLGEQDASWGSEQFALAGGHAILCGPGMYVNRAMAVGFDDSLPESDWRHFEDRCEAVGVSPEFEVSPATAAAVRTQLSTRGYRLARTQAALFYQLDESRPIAEPNPEFLIEPANDRLLSLWQETSARGWRHTSQGARRVSDAYSRAVAAIDGERLLLALDSSDGRPVGCASMTVNGATVTLGGMSTLPSERGRGVQATLIAHRLRLAKTLGCDLATTTAIPGGTSEQNLLRCGFEQRFLLEVHALGG